MSVQLPHPHTPIRPYGFVLLFLAVIVFLLLSAPSNHCEAEDTYYYAKMAEQGSWSELFHQHHLLYLPVVRGVYCTVQALGYSGRSLPVLIGVSMVSAATVICLFAAMLARSGKSRLWVLPLLFSYGFWRYACAAEIYLPALALACGAWFFANRPKGLIGAIGCAVGALLLHLVCLPAVFAVGLLFVWKKEWKQAAIFYGCTGGLAAVVYGWVSGTVGTVVFQDVNAVRGSLFELSTWLKGLFAFGQNLLSGSFLFSITPVAEKLTEMYPTRMLQEELYMGRQAGAVWQGMSVVTFAGALLTLGTVVVGGLRGWRRLCCPAAIWLAGNVAMALLFEPANPEMWIFALLPFWMLVSNVWTPSDAASGGLFNGWKKALLVLPVVMFLHNALGGMAFVKSEQGDYCRQKAALAEGVVGADDLVLSVESHSFVTYLDYRVPGRVMNAKFISMPQFESLLNQTKGLVFVYDDLICLPGPVAARGAEAVRPIQEVADRLRPQLRQVSENDTGTFFVWQDDIVNGAE